MTPSGDSDAALADTSVAVAALVEEHEIHATASALVDRYERVGLAGHAWFETYSVLTRLPSPLRLTGPEAALLISGSFPTVSWLGADQHLELSERLVHLGVQGGAVYDALVGWAAVIADRPLLSVDRRAHPTYQALGVRVVRS